VTLQRALYEDLTDEERLNPMSSRGHAARLQNYRNEQALEAAAEAAAVRPTFTDPFESTPDADPADSDIRRPWKSRPTAKPCDVASKPKKKKVDLNPLERRHLEREGYVFARVEGQNPWGGVTQDLWHCWDFIAAHPDHQGILFIQLTDSHDLARRRRKIRAQPETAVLLAAGNRCEIHHWRQPGGPGKRWEMRIEEITKEGATK